MLLDINPTLAVGGYPQSWTQFTVNVNAPGRVAFRYFIRTSAGPTGANSNYIGIDSVSVAAGAAGVGGVSIPALGPWGTSAMGLLLAGLGGGVLLRRRRSR